MACLGSIRRAVLPYRPTFSILQYQTRRIDTSLSRRAMTTASASPSIRVIDSPAPLTPPAFYRPTSSTSSSSSSSSPSSSHPPHWNSANPLDPSTPAERRGFQSPWDSAKPDMGPRQLFGAMARSRWSGEGKSSPTPKEGQGLPSVRDCTWNVGGAAGGKSSGTRHDGRTLFTWVGHAACHLQVPLPISESATRSISILTDPVFSKRCAPSQWIGPARITRCPTSVSAMAKETTGRAWPDVILLSHNHYDHLDHNTLYDICTVKDKVIPTFIVPLGVKAWLTSNLKMIPPEKIVELDWWDDRVIEIEFSPGETGRLRLVSTPAQHSTARSGWDRNQTLWCSYALHVLPPFSSPPQPSSSSSSSSFPLPLPRIWFSGDTGYRTLPSTTPTNTSIEPSLPTNPCFTEIGCLLGPFHLSLIACGAYHPRSVFSQVHVAPHEAVAIHKEIGSRKTVGIHHSVWRLTAEDVDEPPKLLRNEAEKEGLGPEQVGCVEIGETIEVPIEVDAGT